MKNVLWLTASAGEASLRQGLAFTPVDLVFMPCCIASELLYGIYERDLDWEQSPVLRYLDELALKPTRPTQLDINQTIVGLGAELPKLKAKLCKGADETRTLKISRLDKALGRLAGNVVPPFLGAAIVACLRELSQLESPSRRLERWRPTASSESAAGMPELLWESLEIMTMRCRDDRGLADQKDGRLRLPQECVKAALDRRVERVVRDEDRLILETRSHRREQLRLDVVFRCPGDPAPRRGRCTNASHGGVFVETRRPGAFREKIELEIRKEDRAYKVVAMVIYTNRNGMGLRFLGGEDLVALRLGLKKHTPPLGPDNL